VLSALKKSTEWNYLKAGSEVEDDEIGKEFLLLLRAKVLLQRN
jgi:hypothetical protein